MQGALKYFTDIDDPRSPRNQKHPLIMLIGTTLLASLSGIDSFSGFADFTESHFEELQKYFDSQAWYKPNPDFKDDQLNEIESQNLAKIKEAEESATSKFSEAEG